jgi:hypothetical protein
MSSLTFSRHVIDTPKKIVESLSAILAKAESHPKAAELPEARLAEDMFPLTFQVWCVSDNICKGIARAQGTEPPVLERDLKTIADMQARLKLTAEHLDKADAALINKREAETVTLGLGPGKSGQMSALNYILGYSQPNVYFHLNMAYAILRKEGVEIGKQDYLAPFTKGDLTVL